MRALHHKNNPPDFIHTLLPHAILPALPLPDGSRTLSTRREEGLPGLAVTCGEDGEEAEAIGVPLAGGSHKDTCKASHRARLRVVPADKAGTRPSNRSGPVADMTGFPLSVRAGIPRPTRTARPGRDRSNPGGNDISGSARRRLSDADIIRRQSGRARAAPPFTHSPEAKPACGPPDLHFTNSGVEARGGFRGA
ncbi:hypothetical protein SAMN05877838_1710 [Hoeflea halophila]|uniref:Uncharacterized protein n=1 Tax=Hoeflea halophila TaxID=714899 RepID=A0A286I9M8_9HYPH|nr:hypothetical protein SAMN05877838_1710 [Hoeflea halophila]